MSAATLVADKGACVSETGTASAYENFDLKAAADEAKPATVRFAFEFPTLLEDFRRLDKIANGAKRTSRRMGFLSIGLVLIGLLIASSAPALHELHVSHDTHVALGYLSAGLGIVGAFIGFLGLHRTSSRNKWLRARVQTEMMCVFHFHYMSARAPEVIAAADDPARQAAYVAARQAAYHALKTGALATPDKLLQDIATRTDPPSADSVAELPLQGGETLESSAQLFAAWRKLRLEWQLGYCEAKLSHKASGRRLSSRQTEHLMGGVGWTLLAIVVGLHLIMVAAEPLNLPRVWLEVVVIWAALIALATRALEDGLQPKREVERYEQYRAAILVARERFDMAQDIGAKLEIMRSFERTSLEEMRIFMRTHARSRFML